jgi:signal peptidase II
MTQSRKFAFWPVLLGLLALDCTTKEIAVDQLSPAHVPHSVIGDVVRFTLAYNPDAAMGLSLGEYSRVGFIALAAAMLCGLVLYYRRLPPGNNGVTTLALALIGGGAAGNLLDRLRSSRGVVDFIDIGVGDVRFWTFNIADAGVFCGAMLMLLVLSRADSDGVRLRGGGDHEDHEEHEKQQL